MPMFRKQLVIPILAVILVIAAIAYESFSQQSVSLQQTSGETKSSEATQKNEGGEIVAYVTGAVNSPGVVELPEGARVMDAVNKCGGLSEAADADSINLAAKVTDGSQIKIPLKNAANTAQGETKDNNAGDKININYADEGELDKLPGVGPAMEKRIIEYRQTQGLFQSIEDLKKVRGIGEAKFTKLKDKIMI